MTIPLRETPNRPMPWLRCSTGIIVACVTAGPISANRHARRRLQTYLSVRYHPGERLATVTIVIDEDPVGGNAGICIRVRVLNPQGQLLGGTVDLEFQPQTSGQTTSIKGRDASKEIDVSGLQRTPPELYQLTVTPTDVFRPTSQFVTIPASGFNTITFMIDKGTTQSWQYSLQGNLVFDHILPAAKITVRLFNVGFGGQDGQLGEVKSDAQGKYSFSYTPPKAAAPNQATDLQVRVLDPARENIIISAPRYNTGQTECLNLVVPRAFSRWRPSILFGACSATDASIVQTFKDGILLRSMTYRQYRAPSRNAAQYS
jgi:hypothetical protein